MVRYWGMPEQEERRPTVLEKPDCLEGYASEHWDAIVPILTRMNVLHPIDREALTCLCQWWHEYRLLVESDSGGEAGAYKRSIALASCFKNWSTLAAKFGLTPKDREKITFSADTRDPAAEFLA